MESPTKILEDDMARATALERDKEYAQAAKIYELLLKNYPGNVKILTRLIINYRKLKEYKKELKHINALIKINQSFYAPQTRKGAIVISISEKINRSLGTTDKAGKKIYADDLIKKLEKRKEGVLKKIDKAE